MNKQNKNKMSEKSVGKDTRTLNWVATCWDVEPPKFNEKTMKYLAYGQKVCPTSGKKHWQTFVGFKNKKSLSSVIKELGQKTHPYCAVMKGSIQNNIDYCSKEGTLIKHGDFPKQGVRNDLKTVSELVRQGLTDLQIINTVETIETADGPKTIDYGEKWRHNYKGIQALRMKVKELDRFWSMDVRIYWGPPGTGKTKSVFDEFPHEDIYVKGVGKWWDGYNGEPVVLIDDFDPVNCFEIQYDFYLKLLDRYKLQVEYKGGYCKFYSKIIIFTSNFNPITWFTEKKNRDAFFRRVTSIRHFPSTMSVSGKLGEGNIVLPPTQEQEEDPVLAFHKMICEKFPQEYEEF